MFSEVQMKWTSRSSSADRELHLKFKSSSSPIAPARGRRHLSTKKAYVWRCPKQGPASAKPGKYKTNTKCKTHRIQNQYKTILFNKTTLNQPRISYLATVKQLKDLFNIKKCLKSKILSFAWRIWKWKEKKDKKYVSSWPPVDLYLISEKSIWKNQVQRTDFLVYFELDFYCLCSLQKSISKSNWFFSFLNLIFGNWKKIKWHSIFQKSSGDRQGVMLLESFTMVHLIFQVF